jgi:phosphoglycerate dehydrogenase-like enzyme
LLSLIRPGGVFINSARGIIVNQEDLTDIALKGEILIALDVYEPEPLDKNSLLRGCENVLLTPHVAGPTKDNRALCGLYCLRNVENYLLGKPVKSIITTDDYDRMSPN